MTSSHPDKDNPRGAVASSADKATAQSKEGAPGKREHRSPSPVDDSTDGVMEDAERKQAEERARFQANLLDAVGQAVIVTDLEGKVTYWNRAAEELYGWSEEEAMGRSILEVTPSEEMLEQAEEIMSELVAGRSWSGEFEVRRKDGTTFPAMVIDTPVHDEEGNLVAIIGVSTDVTEIKKTQDLRSSEERFRALTQNSSDIITLLGAGGTIRYQSPSVERILGYRPEEMLGENAFGYVHPEDLRRVQGKFVDGLDDPDLRPSAEYRFRHKDGSWRYLESVGSNLLGDPAVGEFVVNSRDITERKRYEETLLRSQKGLAEAQRIAHLGNSEWNLKTGEVYWSEEIFRIYGFEPNGFSPTFETVEGVFHPDNRHLFRATIEDAYQEAESYDFEHRIVRADGEVRWVHRLGEVVRGEGGEPLRIICTVHDITEHKALEGRLEYQAFHDELTDLPNRRLFIERLKQALKRTRRRRRGRKVAVLYLDLDNFKVVNDSLGHEAGDLLLIAAGERLRWCLRPEDALSRFGGDEFAILLEEVEAPSDAAKVAERIVERFGEPFVVEGREFVIKPSIGIALGTARQNTAEDLLREADAAMYQAKGQEDHYRVFEPAMHEQALRRLKLESDLRRAIEDEEFVVFYQPIVNLETGEASGVEALVRWEHPEQQGLLAPSEFIPVAEESGLVVPMGRWVLEEACRQAVRWQQEHPHVPPLFMAVNLSARQLQHPDVPEMVEEVLEKTGFDASSLSLDITETVYIEVLTGNIAALDKLKKRGVRISIDDFGTGYSSLAYLKRIPADILKIDRTFVGGLGEDVEDTAIVQMIVDLAHTFGMEVIAEGVESEEQAEQLKEMGCDRGQGYYFAKPLAPEAASEFLAR